MGKNNNFIELNGKRYDALTGELLRGAPVTAKTLHTKKSIGGIVRTHKLAPQAGTAIHKVPGKIPAPQPQAAKPAPVHSAKRSMDVIAPRSQHHAKPHQPEHARTLMRSAVKKPADSLKRHANVQLRTDILAKAPSVAVMPKFSFQNVDPERLARAKRVAKSRLISRFSPMTNTSFAVASSASAPASASISAPAPTVRIAPLQRPTAATHTSGRSMDIFQKALTHATSHEQPAVHPRKHAKKIRTSRKSRLGHRALNVAATALSFILIAGFIGYQNKANITMHVASAKAGFHANLPGYKPAGFAVGKFTYSTGAVAVNYHSNSDSSRAFTVTQKPSNWDSETLLDNYVAANSEQYQTIQSAGRTIYMYGHNNATWVDNGVWYQVTDDGSLSTNQVLNIASSM